MEDYATPELDGRQLALYEALLEKDQVLARMYFGALTVLRDTDNPERFPQASHSLRELMEKIPQLVDVKTKALQEKLIDKVRQLEDVWNTTVTNSDCHNAENWHGEIDKHLLKMLKIFQNFFHWLCEHRPRRRKEVVATLRGLEISDQRLPEELENLNAQSWDKIKDYFIGVAHHRKTENTQENFEQWLYALERFLLDRLRPPTYADLDRTIRIIQEGERND